MKPVAAAVACHAEKHNDRKTDLCGGGPTLTFTFFVFSYRLFEQGTTVRCCIVALLLVL